ncbi:MAG TPA: hypothetical protein VMH86_03595 [Rhizomicrobium sp.]|nr:hypothetical protein [Rhizomicrobium sp.]
MNKVLSDLLDRAKGWPKGAQDELARVALQIEAELGQGDYHATPEELAGVDRGLRDSADGKFASAAEVEATLAKYRGS